MMQHEWTEVLRVYGETDAVLVDLLAIVAEATRELCAEFPQHGCHNGATNNWQVADKVKKHLEANFSRRVAT